MAMFETWEKASWMKPKTTDSGMYRIIQSSIPTNLKFRRVCNAAANNKGESLTDKLLTGVEFLQKLVGINFRFRKHQIALTADIEAMFLQLKVQAQECRVLRFL